jgi:hypothetical protein
MCVGIGAIPGFIGIFYRMTVKESARFTADVRGDADA